MPFCCYVCMLNAFISMHGTVSANRPRHIQYHKVAFLKMTDRSAYALLFLGCMKTCLVKLCLPNAASLKLDIVSCKLQTRYSCCSSALGKSNINKYKKQLNWRTKKQTRIWASWQDDPYAHFYRNCCSKIRCRDASCQLAQILVCLLFGPTIPTCFFNLILVIYSFLTESQQRVQSWAAAWQKSLSYCMQASAAWCLKNMTIMVWYLTNSRGVCSHPGTKVPIPCLKPGSEVCYLAFCLVSVVLLD